MAGKFLWIMVGLIGSFVLNILLDRIKTAFSKNATKENVASKTDLLEKDIQHLNKEMISSQLEIEALHKRISHLRDGIEKVYVSKELFQESLKQFNVKLDTILKFVKKDYESI